MALKDILSIRRNIFEVEGMVPISPLSQTR